jgi:hypothetical protein
VSDAPSPPILNFVTVHNHLLLSFPTAFGAIRFDRGFHPRFRYGNLSLARANQWGYLRVSATTEALTLEFVANVDNSVWDTTALHPWPEAQ